MEFRRLFISVLIGGLALGACSGDQTAPTPPHTASAAAGDAASPITATAGGELTFDASQETTGQDPVRDAASTGAPTPGRPDPAVVTEHPAPEIEASQLGLSQEREELVKPAVEVAALALSGDLQDELASFSTVAEGPALDQVRARVEEFDDNGWRQAGSPVIRSATILSLDERAEPPSVVIEACLDSSDVDITDDAGKSQVDRDAPARALNLFTLHLIDGKWIVHDWTFPVDTDC